MCYWNLNTSNFSNKPLNTQETQFTCSYIKYTFKQKQKKKNFQQPNAPSNTSNARKLQNANPSRSISQSQNNQNSRHSTCMMGPYTYYISIGLKIRFESSFASWSLATLWFLSLVVGPTYNLGLEVSKHGSSFGLAFLPSRVLSL